MPLFIPKLTIITGPIAGGKSYLANILAAAQASEAITVNEATAEAILSPRILPDQQIFATTNDEFAVRKMLRAAEQKGWKVRLISLQNIEFHELRTLCRDY